MRVGFSLLCLLGVSDSRGSSDDEAGLLQAANLAGAAAEEEMLAKAAILSEQLVDAAEELPAGPTQEFISALRICGKCSQFKRYGELNDGGYLTCMDGLDHTVSAISVGVEQHDQWSQDTATAHGIKVAQFDCTVDMGASCGGACTFHKQCLISSDAHEHSTLHPQVTLQQAQELAMGGDIPDRSLLLKIDCEGCEWPIFEVEQADVMRKFSQIIVEFHWLDKLQLHAQYAAAMRNLLQNGFKVVHLHGNNYAGLYQPTSDVSVPDVLEVTFVAEADDLPQCETTQQYNDALDHPNNEFAPELRMATFGTD